MTKDLKDLKNAQGERLDCSFHAGRSDQKNLVVLGHGVTGNKDRPFLVAMAEGLNQSGLHVLRFSFSGNGQSEGAFAESTISKEVEDLGAVLDALGDYHLCYAGHSMGGAVGVIRASRDPRLRLLISLAGMVETKAFAEREFSSVKPGEGFMWDNPACPLSQVYMDDMNRIGSVADCAPRIHVPWLLVHGTADDVVPIQDSREIYQRANPPKDLVELENADHVFSDAHTPRMAETVVRWLNEKLA